MGSLRADITDFQHHRVGEAVLKVEIPQLGVGGSEVLVECGDADTAGTCFAATGFGEGGIDQNAALDHLVEALSIDDLIAAGGIQAGSEDGDVLGSIILEDGLHVDGVVVEAVSAAKNRIAG